MAARPWLVAAGAVRAAADRSGLLAVQKNHPQHRALRSAKRILRQIQGDASRDDWQKVADISTLLRRTAISCYPREQVAELTGQDWLLFLDRPFSSPRFATPLGRSLLEVPYRKQGTGKIPVAALLQLCEDWLRALDGQKR